MPSEHERLADACSNFFEALAPDFAGDMPTAIQAIADFIVKYVKPDDETLSGLRHAAEETM